MSNNNNKVLLMTPSQMIESINDCVETIRDLDLFLSVNTDELDLAKKYLRDLPAQSNVLTNRKIFLQCVALLSSMLMRYEAGDEGVYQRLYGKSHSGADSFAQWLTEHPHATLQELLEAHPQSDLEVLNVILKMKPVVSAGEGQVSSQTFGIRLLAMNVKDFLFVVRTLLDEELNFLARGLPDDKILRLEDRAFSEGNLNWLQQSTDPTNLLVFISHYGADMPMPLPERRRSSIGVLSSSVAASASSQSKLSFDRALRMFFAVTTSGQIQNLAKCLREVRNRSSLQGGVNITTGVTPKSLKKFLANALEELVKLENHPLFGGVMSDTQLKKMNVSSIESIKASLKAMRTARLEGSAASAQGAARRVRFAEP
jgi:hypothetical protein